ncbi:hypothetical protein CRC_03313 [Cylindrospermopsis raciborskii CS-505]|nr:hypothetical protein CRC_03313 [Cylindrospermopsis raciborskii CS-505]
MELAWDDLYSSSFGTSRLKIGKDIFLPAQATGVILEKLIAFHRAKKFPTWRGGRQFSMWIFRFDLIEFL